MELSGSFTTDVKSRRRGSRPLGFASVEEAIRKRVSAMFYGATIWDPWLIVGQIVCIQCLYYLSLGLLLSLLVGTQVPRFTLNYFFNYTHVSASSFVGWCTIIAYFINSLAGYVDYSLTDTSGEGNIDYLGLLEMPGKPLLLTHRNMLQCRSSFSNRMSINLWSLLYL